MIHLTSRHQLIQWVSDNAPNRTVQRAVDRGKVVNHGLFVGGWVVSAEYGGQTWIVGIKPTGFPPRLISGLLKAVPVDEYVGGDGVLAGGDKEVER